MNIILIRKHVVDMDVVNDVMCSRQGVITRVDIRFLLHSVINWITATSYDKFVYKDTWFHKDKDKQNIYRLHTQLCSGRWSFLVYKIVLRIIATRLCSE